MGQPVGPGLDWATVTEWIGGLLMSLLGWLSLGALKDVKFLNRNAVLKTELDTQFGEMRKERREMHDENTARLQLISAQINAVESVNRRAREEAQDEVQRLMLRIEEVHALSIQRDALKQDRE